MKKKNRVEGCNESFNRVMQAKVNYNNTKYRARVVYEKNEQKYMKNLANSNPVRKLRSKQNHAHHISIEKLTEHFQEV